MTFGVTGYADRKLIAGMYELHKVIGITEPTFGLQKNFVISRGVSPQGQDVLYVMLFQIAEDLGDIVLGRLHAGEVREDLLSEIVLDF